MGQSTDQMVFNFCSIYSGIAELMTESDGVPDYR